MQTYKENRHKFPILSSPQHGKVVSVIPNLQTAEAVSWASQEGISNTPACGAGGSHGRVFCGDILSNPLLPPGVSLSNCVGLSHLFDKVICKEKHKEKLLLKEDQEYLSKSHFPYCLPLSQLLLRHTIASYFCIFTAVSWSVLQRISVYFITVGKSWQDLCHLSMEQRDTGNLTVKII